MEAFSPAGGGSFVWNGYQFEDGRLAVEINHGNANGWIEVRTLGAVGLLPAGRVNRDGIGAVIRVTPAGLPTTLRPVTGGSSFASQNAPEQLFGLAQAKTATVEVLWPGGTLNRFYGVKAGERIVFPEIPCDPRDHSLSRRQYRSCVAGALELLRDRGLLSRALAARLLTSALHARKAERRRTASEGSQ